MKNPKPENRNPKFATAPCAVRSVLECGRERGASGNRSADFQSAVSRISNPQAPRKLEDDREFNALPTGSRRHSRLETCATGWWPSRLVLALGFLCSLLCLPAFAQYAIDWHTMDGGGGTSTGAVYSVSGTIGQPDAGGPMTGGNFSLTGGFWALPQAVQTPGAPTLYITNAAAGWATLWWTPSTGTNWVLQERLNLTTGAWSNVPSGPTNPVTVPATLPAKFYRLFKP
jgi:hypothetical protein